MPLASRRTGPPPGGGDRALLARVAAGDRDAFADLYHRYHPRLVRYLYRVTRSAEVVEEVVNDVMMVVWNAADTFEGRSKVSTWVLGIAYRQAMKALGRRKGRDVPVEPAAIDRQAASEDRTLRRRELRLTLDAALEQLSPEQRAVVELTYYHGHSYPEIAEIMEIPLGTVKSRMFHARKLLRSALERAESPVRGLEA